jgi:5-methylcytosine-specific restriction endonuclease McrA
MMKTFGFWFYDELLPNIQTHYKKVLLETARGSFVVNVGSTRLSCFKKNNRCVTCGRVGELWLLQSWSGERPHLNLYSVGHRGGLTLMTQDHIMPKSKGGTNELWNLQTMCRVCNNRKGAEFKQSVTKDQRFTAMNFYADYLSTLRFSR